MAYDAPGGGIGRYVRPAAPWLIGGPRLRCVGSSLMIVSVRECVRRRCSMRGRGWGGAGLRSAEGARTIVPARALHACVWVPTSLTSLSCRSPHVVCVYNGSWLVS
eukprot:4369150-Prymnesium_polylepis.1